MGCYCEQRKSPHILSVSTPYVLFEKSGSQTKVENQEERFPSNVGLGKEATEPLRYHNRWWTHHQSINFPNWWHVAMRSNEDLQVMCEGM